MANIRQVVCAHEPESFFGGVEKFALYGGAIPVSSPRMHADLEKLLSLGKINAALAEKLDRVSPGHYCYHKQWGIGKVLSWSLPKKTVEIDFEAKSNHQMALDLALKSLEFIDGGHFLVKRFEELEHLRELASSDPVELVRVTLEGHGNSLKPEDLEKSLKGSVVPTAKWKSWWDSVRSQLNARVEFAMPTRKGEPIRLRQEASSYVETVIEDYQFNRDLKAKVRVLDTVKAERIAPDKAHVLELVSLIDKDVRSAGSLALQQAMELAVFRDEFVRATGAGDEVISGLYALPDMLCEYKAQLPDVMGNIPALRQKTIYEAFPVAFGDDWVRQALRVFDNGGARAIGEVGKFIKEQGEGERLMQHLTKGLHTQTIQPDGLVWICRNREGDSGPVFCMEVGSAMLAHIDHDHTEGGPSRMLRLKNLLMDDVGLVRDFVKNKGVAEIRQFAKTLFASAAFPELDRKALMARLMEAGPKVKQMIADMLHAQEEGDDSDSHGPVFVSWESLDKKKAEYEELVNVKIPQNKHNKTVFRAEGDLRENAGYQDAKEVERVLNRRRSELEKDLAMARGTDFKGADTSSVSMGTTVTLQPSKGEAVAYTVLGAWDSDADRHIVSYLSEAGKKLIGTKPGDTIRMIPIHSDHEETFTVKAIEAVNP